MKSRNFIFFYVILFSFITAISNAEIKKEVVEYKLGNSTFEGYLVYDDAFEGPRPTVLIVHQWMGLSDHEKLSAEKLAESGYVAFAIDVFGKGIRPQNTDEAGKLATQLKSDTALFRQRQKAALEYISKNKRVNKKAIVVMGYCMGGTGALEAARAGFKLAGAVSFHGGLSTKMPSEAKNIKSKLLVLHGAIDPLVPQKEVDSFLKEMNDAKVDYQFIAYSGAVHAFTQKGAGNDPTKGFAYDKRADTRSWAALMAFLDEVAPASQDKF